MIKNGFDIRHDSDGKFAVIDLFNGAVVVINGHLQTGLTEAMAEAALDYLSRKYSERHDEGGSGRLP